MKPVSLPKVVLGVLLVLAAVAGGLAFTPTVQRWALRRVMGAQPGLKFEAAAVAAGLTHFRLDGVRLQKSGVVVQIGQLEADYSPWQLLFNHRLVLGQLTGRDLLVDASKLSARRAGAVAAGASAGAPGLLTQIELPVGLVLADCLLEGRALLPGSTDGPPVEATGKITGGKFAPGQEGTLVLAATLTNPMPAARVSTLRAELSLRAFQTEQRNFSRVSVIAVVDAEGENLSGQQQLKISAEMTKTAVGENYELSMDTLIQGKAENLLVVHGGLTAEHRDYAGNWKLKARNTQFEPFFLGRALPDFQASGEGLFTFDPAAREITLLGKLEAGVSRLETWEPAWRAIGAVKLSTQFNMVLGENFARINQSQLTVAGDQPVLELSIRQTAEFNFKTRHFQTDSKTQGEAASLTLQGLPVAWIRPFVYPVDVSGGMITGQLAITGEQEQLRLRVLHPLQVGEVSVVKAGRLLLDKADLDLEFEAALNETGLQADVARLSLQTPAGDSLEAKGRVLWPAGVDTMLTVSGTCSADLPTLLAPWLPLGHVRATGETDFSLTGHNLDLRRLETRVTDMTGLELFRATALRPFTFDQVAHRVTVPGTTSGGDLLRVAVGRLPLAALRLTLPGAKLGGSVAAGELVVAMDGEKLTVRAPTGLKLADVSFSAQGRPALLGLSIEAQPVFEQIDQANSKFESGPITVRSANGTVLATLKAEGTQAAAAGMSGSLTFAVEVPALGTQPIFRGAKLVSAGRASGEVRVVLGAARQVEARATVNGLVAVGTNEILPVANISFRAVVQSDGKISAQVPVLLDRGGSRSDLALAAELTPAGRGYLLDGKLTGEHVELNDARAVLGVFMVSAGDTTPPVEPTEPASVAVDAVSAWSRFTGRLALDVKSVALGADWAMTGLTGSVAIEPSDVTLQKLEATFGDKGRFAAKGLLSFTKGPQPYDLAGGFSLTEFDAGKLFKALDPAKPATVEGVFAVAGNVTGSGETVARALEHGHGSFALTSRQGIFRGLQRTTSKVSLATKAVDLVGSLFGSSRVVEKVAGAAFYVDQLAQALGELNYDQLSVKLVRDQALNISLEDISLVTPEIRLLGKGSVTYSSGKPLLEQPLSAALTIAGRGKIEEQLGKLRLLSGARDELDYAKARETITLGGTLARPDPSAFFTRIAAGKLTELLAPGN